MIRLIRAEFLKLRTTQVWFWLLLTVLAIGVLVIIGSLLPSDGVQSAAQVPDIFANTNSAAIAVFVLGVLGVTTEFRYQTITPTVLVTPSRWSLISAKLLAYAIVGACYAVAVIVVELAIALPWLAHRNIDFDLGDPDLRRTLFGLFLVLALYGVVGLGVGALLRNQVVAVTVGVIFLLVLQNLLILIPGVRAVWEYLPAGATTAILYTSSFDAPSDTVHLASPLVGVFTLVLWAVVPAVIGASFTMNRDIT